LRVTAAKAFDFGGIFGYSVFASRYVLGES